MVNTDPDPLYNMKKLVLAMHDDNNVLRAEYTIKTKEMYEAMKPLREQACLISQCDNAVTIDCDEFEDAERLFEFLANYPSDGSKQEKQS